MRNFNMTIWFCTTLIISLFLNCKNTDGKKDTFALNRQVISIENDSLVEISKKLNLDSVYPNLLDPRISKRADFDRVFELWTSFHQRVNKYIKEQNFKWEVKDSFISVTNKLYFDKTGKVDYYFYRIDNPGVSEEKKKEYEKVLESFVKNVQIDLAMDNKFGQCGKIKYLNY